MNKTIAVTITACWIVCVYACNDNNTSKQKIEEDLYGRLEKQIDSFAATSLSTFSINRIKKVAERIGQPKLNETLVLDTLPDNSTINVKQLNDDLVYYQKDGTITRQLYSLSKFDSISRMILAAILFEKMKQEKCEQWRKICENPQSPLSHEDRLKCKLNITFYCN